MQNYAAVQRYDGSATDYWVMTCNICQEAQTAERGVSLAVVSDMARSHLLNWHGIQRDKARGYARHIQQVVSRMERAA